MNGVALVVWCQALQQHNDLDGALNTLSIADSLSITPEPAHYTVLLSCAAELKSLTATKHIHMHLNHYFGTGTNIIVHCALMKSYAQCGDLETAKSLFHDALKQNKVRIT